jgi:hypothetical protein
MDWESADCAATWGELEDREQTALRREFRCLPTTGGPSRVVRVHPCRIPATRRGAVHLDVVIEYTYRKKLRLIAEFVVTCLRCEVPAGAYGAT